MVAGESGSISNSQKTKKMTRAQKLVMGEALIFCINTVVQHGDILFFSLLLCDAFEK